MSLEAKLESALCIHEWHTTLACFLGCPFPHAFSGGRNGSLFDEVATGFSLFLVVGPHILLAQFDKRLLLAVAWGSAVLALQWSVAGNGKELESGDTARTLTMPLPVEEFATRGSLESLPVRAGVGEFPIFPSFTASCAFSTCRCRKVLSS